MSLHGTEKFNTGRIGPDVQPHFFTAPRRASQIWKAFDDKTCRNILSFSLRALSSEKTGPGGMRRGGISSKRPEVLEVPG